jgi:pimeloyl-ACP methyl ester carboxylesterase
MTILAVRTGGSLTLAPPLDANASRTKDHWAQDDQTSRLSALERVRLSGTASAIGPQTIPLVLLHAFPLSSDMWGDLILELPELPLLLIDLPGAGLSPTVEPISIEGAALAVGATLEKLSVKRCVVAGISMGGYVALSLMRLRPDLLAGVILMHTKAQADADETKLARLEVARQVLDSSSVATLSDMALQLVSGHSKAAVPGLVDRLRQWIAQATPEGVAWAEEAMASRQDSFEVLRSSGLPATVITGEDDRFASVADAEMMADMLGPGSNLVVLTGVGHLSAVEVPAVVARLLRESYYRMTR